MKKTTVKGNKINTIDVIINISIIIIMTLCLLGMFVIVDNIEKFDPDIFNGCNKEKIKIIKLTTDGILVLIHLVIIMWNLQRVYGYFSARKKYKSEQKEMEKDNPYIYFRELPNPYGIGVNTLLIDSKIENKKDLVAVILDLCARGYLGLNNVKGKYIIKVKNSDFTKLLKNEKYIMKNIINNTISKISYREWFDLAVEDGTELNLFTKADKKNNYRLLTKERTAKQWKIYLTVCLTLCIIFSILTLLFNKQNLGPIASILYFGIIAAILFFLLLIILFFPVYYLPLIFNIGKTYQDITFNRTLEGKLRPTSEGIENIHKLESFKSFINDFGFFAQKNPEEVILWEYYLSYAQLFGLTDKILKTGYKQLVVNPSFEIENINDINLEDLNTENQDDKIV